jgi:hypothetical protein
MSAGRESDQTAGGFNPSRPREKDKHRVGPMPTDDPNRVIQSRKPRIDPALKSTSKEKAVPSESDDYPEEGAVRHRGDVNDQQEP